MDKLQELLKKEEKLVIGLMSGTSADGVDAVLLRISGHGLDTQVEQIAFVSPPYSDEVRNRILKVAEGTFGGAREICLLNFLLGELFADACFQLCEKAGIKTEDVDLIGTHGQTIYHIPVPEAYLGHELTATLQIGEPSILCERIGAVTVSDFRVRDVAAQGLGAPLVPYTEYLLYSDPLRNVALQNIGGIGNITVLPAAGRARHEKNASRLAGALEALTAFDTGPGNMVMDEIISRMTGGRLHYDKDGEAAARGHVSAPLLEWMMQDDYLHQKPPKTTGRERYGRRYVDELMKKGACLCVSEEDILTTATMFTAASIAYSIREYCEPKPDWLIVGGGGSYNLTLMRMLRERLPEMVVLTNEALGMDGAAKEAIAFAVLANEAIHSQCNNATAATGAIHPVVMGKISQ
ncbi:MAG: anhydro-N-acetylmuramic acid kinase [Lachnospiraceae bacterium]|nr:anhydro-N-acetylmuramic acid kinase [Lachnospiraceae bacterium]